jgi:hypothetical protein
MMISCFLSPHEFTAGIGAGSREITFGRPSIVKADVVASSAHEIWWLVRNPS